MSYHTGGSKREQAEGILLRVLRVLSGFLFFRYLFTTEDTEELKKQSDMENPASRLKVEAPILALDLGKKRVGVAVSDSLMISITPHEPLPRSNWKQLVRDVIDLTQRFDARTLVIGLPLRLDGTIGQAASESQRTAIKFAQTIKIPVYLQDERLSSKEAEELLRAQGYKGKALTALVDSHSAALILRDFISGGQQKSPVLPPK